MSLWYLSFVKPIRSIKSKKIVSLPSPCSNSDYENEFNFWFWFCISLCVWMYICVCVYTFRLKKVHIFYIIVLHLLLSEVKYCFQPLWRHLYCFFFALSISISLSVSLFNPFCLCQDSCSYFQVNACYNYK